MSVFWRILIYIKRLCKMPAFVIALLLMPVIAYGIKNFTTLENKGITVGVYATGEVGKAVCEDLLSKDYVVKFEKYDSIEKMKEDVEFKTIECGYVFENSFEDGYKKGDLTRSIGCITSNSSVLHKMINEVVYSSIIKKQAPEIANNYLKDKNIPVTVDDDYGKYMDSDKLFTVDTEYVDSPQIASKKLFSVSNVVALYTMLGVVLLSVNAVRDRKKGIRINGYFCIKFSTFPDGFTWGLTVGSRIESRHVRRLAVAGIRRVHDAPAANAFPDRHRHLPLPDDHGRLVPRRKRLRRLPPDQPAPVRRARPRLPRHRTGENGPRPRRHTGRRSHGRGGGHGRPRRGHGADGPRGYHESHL